MVRFGYNDLMRRRLWFFPLALVVLLAHPHTVFSQTATLKAIHAEGMKTFTEAQVASLSGLGVNSQVGRKELQDGADLLLRSGFFTKVTYKFDTHNDAVTVTYHLEETPRLLVAYDNFPWFTDGELSDAIKTNLPFFDGTLPEGGTVVDLAGNSIASFLTEHGLKAEVRHFVLADPLLDASVQQFQVEGVTQRISSIDFSDPALKDNLAVQQHLGEIRGKNYSRLAIDLFLAEAIRPIYQQQGYLRTKIGPAEVRLSGNPNQKFPGDIPVYVPCAPGALFQWKGAEWKGNNAVSTETLKRTLGVKPGDPANGLAIEGAWDRVREVFGRLGYLDVMVTPVPTYDDSAHTVSYSIEIVEGKPYRFEEMTITGMSLAGERFVRDAWPIKPGEILDKTVFEQFLTTLESHRDNIFKGLPVHYDSVGHWLQPDPEKGTVDVLLDFK
jgi:outer membrane protein assembly factor BamA